MPPRALLAVGAALPLLALAACGDGGGGDRLSKRELVQQANAICADYGKRIDEIQKKYERRITGLEGKRNLDAIADFAGESRTVAADGVAELRALEPPDDLEQRYDEWLATGDKTVERIDDLHDAAEAGDSRGVKQIVGRADDEQRESDRLAAQLGLTECAED
ncbi:MAG: hypothetical protein M3229_03395 [Actinomycetota bacterium]|nr:hypothetical protein [Actinomycetota bacterium]